MTRRRWIADEVSRNRAALTGAHADHLIRVLRARVGQEFDIVANAVVHRGRVAAIGDGRVEFELGEEISAEPTSLQLTLLLAIFKFDRLEWAIEKCTELGVTRIIPLIARRTDSHLVSASAKRVERWRRISVQAAEQSRSPAPPEIADPIKLQAALTIPAKLKIVLSEAEEQSHLRDVRAGAGDEVLLAIGPEGGWTQDELDQFHKEGWVSASLGSTILRAETAAIAATAITMALSAGKISL
jgi:16S rRNA (uracil1498-N3)-methyltransferase